MSIDIFKVSVACYDAEGIYTYDGIEYEGELWLVLDWIETTDNRGFAFPERMIRFDNLDYEKSEDDLYDVYELLPQAVLDGESDEGYEVLCSQDHILVEIQKLEPH